LRAFRTSLSFGAPLAIFPLEFRGEGNREETIEYYIESWAILHAVNTA